LNDVFLQLSGMPEAAAVVPIENSIEGPVTQTLDLLAATDGVVVTAAFGLPVQHCLLTAHDTSLASVKSVYSHPQALAQCGQWLSANLPEAALVAVASTSEAARLAAGNRETAAIASRLAAELYGLKLVSDEIQLNRRNETRFVVVRSADSGVKVTMEGITQVKSLLHLAATDRPGALLHLLIPFHEADMNLSFIQSRPLPGHPWQYGFFIEVEGDILGTDFSNTLGQLRSVAATVRVLGVYPSKQNEVK